MKKQNAERSVTSITMMLLTYLSGLYAVWHIVSRMMFGQPLYWYECAVVCIPALVCGALLWLMSKPNNEGLHDLWSVLSLVLACAGAALMIVGVYTQKNQYQEQVNQILYPSIGGAKDWEYWFEVNQCDLNVQELQIGLVFDLLAVLWNVCVVMIVPFVGCGAVAGQVHQEVYGWERSVGGFARKCWLGAFGCGAAVILLYVFQDGGSITGCGLSVLLAFMLLWCTIYTCGRYRREEGSVGRKTIIR